MKEIIRGQEALNYLASKGFSLDIKNGTGGWLQVKSPCPVCGKKYKLYIHDDTGIFKCQYSGCKINEKAVNAADFVMMLTGLSFKDTIAELKGSTGRDITIRPDNATSYDEPDKLDDDERDKSFRCMIKHLNLDADDFENLLSRQLSKSEIESLAYRSLEMDDPEALARIMMREGCKLDGLPGAYLKDGEWSLIKTKREGLKFMVWGKNLKGQIFGAQIRRTPKNDGDPKYTWYSSSYENCDKGTAQKSRIHYAIRRTYDWQTGEAKPVVGSTVYLIEGLLKGDICHLISGKNFFCIAGVTQYKAIKRDINEWKKLGIKEIVTCLDMDYHTNSGVKKSLEVISDILKKEGFSTHQLEWDNEFKGLDDYLVATGDMSIFG